MITACKAGDVFAIRRDPAKSHDPWALELTPVVVISPRKLNIQRNRATIVPLTPRQPKEKDHWFVPIEKEHYWARGYQLWADCRWVSTVDLVRLEH